MRARTPRPTGSFGFSFYARFMRVLFGRDAVQFQSRTVEIDWGLFYAVIIDFYLPPDTGKGKRDRARESETERKKYIHRTVQ
jgi:hypothetical protein